MFHIVSLQSLLQAQRKAAENAVYVEKMLLARIARTTWVHTSSLLSADFKKVR
jgi:hypothetical protein